MSERGLIQRGSRRGLRFIVAAWLLILPLQLWAQANPQDEAARVEFFERRVRPLLVANCYSCHSAETNSKGGLRVDDRNGLVTGGSRGAAIVPGRPDDSLLIQAVAHRGKLKMPPGKKLSDDDVAILSQWISDGAAWTKVEVDESLGAYEADYEDLRKTHWAWQPLRAAPVPEIKDAAWARDDVDRFVLAKLEAEQLAPVADADQLALIRRLSFDLTGLPPTPENIDRFLADESPTAYAALVDRLLASPAFGERWGRHWLDVARFGESTGSARNLPYPHAWRYRDYVIDAFNRDKPFDEFVREQIAGDLLPAASREEKVEHHIATGFLALGVKDVNQRFKVRFVMDNIDEQIDTVSRAILGLTASCARCHDHKFDPIPAADYYALAGIFESTDLCAGLRNKMGGGGLDYYDTNLILEIGETPRPPVTEEQIKAAQAAVDQARAEFVKLRDTPAGAEKLPDGRPKRQAAKQRLDARVAELVKLTDPAANGPVALGVRDAQKIGDTAIRVRGEAEKHGAIVPRGFLTVVQFDGQPTINSAQSGRLELAEWLTDPKNPLTARVIVNRVWQHLFGAGLVRTVDNFGVTGDEPSHPELLDHLARRFVEDGWSIKRLIRALVLTRTYQLSADATDAHLAVDPANRWLWRHTPRRLGAEEIRDAMLAGAGRLKLERPADSPARGLPVIELRNNGPEAQRIAEFTRGDVHRSVYLPLLRTLAPTSLTVFDFAEQGMVTGRRDTTTIAPQALYLLNDAFVRTQARALASRIAEDASLDDTARIERAYRIVLGRAPTTDELERARVYLSDYAAAAASVISTEQLASAEPAGREPTQTNEGATTKSESDTPSVVAEPDPPKPARKKGRRAKRIVSTDQAARPDIVVDEQLPEPTDPKAAAWESFCQALFSSAEFRYLR